MWSVTDDRTVPCRTQRRRRQLLRKLPPLDAVLRGSLIERYKRCGNPRCNAPTAQGMGPSTTCR